MPSSRKGQNCRTHSYLCPTNPFLLTRAGKPKVLPRVARGIPTKKLTPDSLLTQKNSLLTRAVLQTKAAARCVPRRSHHGGLLVADAHRRGSPGAGDRSEDRLISTSVSGRFYRKKVSTKNFVAMQFSARMPYTN